MPKKKELELTELEMRTIVSDTTDNLHLLLESIFCPCEGDNKRIEDYTAYLNDLNDVILKGKCSHCHSPAARYIETGENKDSFVAAERIRKLHKGAH